VGDFTLAYWRPPEHPSPPVNFLDQYDLFQKDSNGDLLIAPSGTARYSRYIGAEFKGYILTTKAGSPVIVYQASPTRRMRYKSNCHGATVLGGDYWLLGNQMDTVLRDTGWTIVAEEQVERGDVVIYRDLEGKIVHSAKVLEKDERGRVLVNSKDGYDLPRQGVWAYAVVPFRRDNPQPQL
jgi:hypothetical protein